MRRRYTCFMAMMLVIALVVSGCSSTKANEVELQVIEDQELADVFDALYVDYLRSMPYFAYLYNSPEDYGIAIEVERKIIPISEQNRLLDEMIEKYSKTLKKVTVEDEFLAQQLEVAIYDLAILKMHQDYAIDFLIYNELDDHLKEYMKVMQEYLVLESEEDFLIYIENVRDCTAFMKDLNEILVSAAERGVKISDYDTKEERKGLKFTSTSSDSNRFYQRFKQAATKVGLNETVYQSLDKTLRVALFDEYVPEAKKVVDQMGKMVAPTGKKTGLSAVPNGEAMYTADIQRHTTTKMTAEEIHELGLKEVAKIQRQMDESLKAYGLTEGSISERMEILRDEDIDYTGDAAKDRYYVARDEILAFLPTVFHDTEMPKHEVIIESSNGGDYYRSPKENDFDSKGTFFLTTFNDHEDYNINTLAFHEMLPGHHLERSNEVTLDLPSFRDMDHFTAFIEGWALYAEHMMDEEFSKDPKYHIGYLEATLLRAVRLVVDTGIHSKGWTEQEAVDYIIENSYYTENSARYQVERYIQMPAQALSYKIGQLEILSLRELMIEKQGDDFNLKDFHHAILNKGSLPLDLLRKNIEEMVE